MKTRDKILDAADSLFGDVGFDASSTRKIAEISDINKALIYYHFKSKEDLFESVMNRYYERAGEKLMAAFSATGSPRERLVRLIDAYADFLAENVNFMRIVQREGAVGNLSESVHERIAALFKIGIDFVNSEYPHTKGTDLDANHLLVSFYGMASGWFTYSGVLEQITGKNPLSKKAVAQRKQHLHRMLDIILDEIES